MPSFAYQSLSNSGQSRSGVLTAMDRADAVRQLLGRGETATMVEPLEMDSAGATRKPAGVSRNGTSNGSLAAPSSGFSLSMPAFGKRKPTLSRSEMANLMRELATALEAGLPLMQSLKTVRRQAVGRGMQTILDHLIQRVETGDPLHMAARDYGPPFDDMVVGMLRAADASGKMSEVLHQLADLLERSLELRREVMGATFYPLIVAGLIAISVVILVTVLVPRLIKPLTQEQGFTLPLPTAILLNIASFLSAYWMFCVIGAAIAWFGWRAWSRVPENRFRIDRFKLRLPLAGKLLRDVAVARFTRTLGTLISAGMPILDALRITKNTLGNAALMHAIEQVQDQVTSGKSLADPMERSGLFPPLLVQVVNLGEKSGRLESMLMHAAGAFDRQVNNSVKLFTKALPPLLLVVMACVGGFVLSAILLPLLELNNIVR